MQVDTTPDSKPDMASEEDEAMTPRRVLEKDDSNDYSSFAGLKEGPGTAALFRCAPCPISPPLCRSCGPGMLVCMHPWACPALGPTCCHQAGSSRECSRRHRCMPSAAPGMGCGRHAC